jgi:predicted transcriptional regulator
MLEICIRMMQVFGMKTQMKSTTAGITVRFSPATREHVTRLARTEHRSAAAYIEWLVERDLREREEAERIVRVHVVEGLPDVPKGEVAREEGESEERHSRRAAVLGALFGAG